MKLPAKIEIGGHDIPVSVKKDLLRKEEMYGYFDTEEFSITIDADMKESLQAETFWHEVLEAANVVYEFEFNHDVIQKLGAVIHQVSKGIAWLPSKSKSGTKKRARATPSQKKRAAKKR